MLIDTTGCEMHELESKDEVSKANEGEVSLVCLHVEDLIKSGLDPADIAVITPYNLQVGEKYLYEIVSKLLQHFSINYIFVITG